MNKYEEFLKGLAELSRRTGITISGDGYLEADALPDGEYLYGHRVEGSYDSIEFSRIRCPQAGGVCGSCQDHPGIHDVAEFDARWGRPARKSTKDL